MELNKMMNGRISPPSLATIPEIMDMRDVRWFLRKHWFFLAAGAVFGAGLGFAWTYFFPSNFRSEAKVRFMPPQLAGKFVNPNFSMAVEQRLFALSQLLASRLTASRMIDSFRLYPERRRFQTVADLVPVFGEALAIRQISLGDDQHKSVPTLQIQFAYPNAEQAQKVVQKLVEQIYEENRKYRGDQSMGTTEFLAEQLRAAEEGMLEAEGRLGEIQDALRPNASRTLLGESTSRSYVVDSRLRDLRHDRRLLDERRSLKQAEAVQLEADSRVIEARPTEYYFPQVEVGHNFLSLREKVTNAKMQAFRMRERWRPGFTDREMAEADLREAESITQKFMADQSRLLKMQDLDRVRSRIGLARSELRGLELQDGSSQKEEIELRAEAQRLKDQNAAPAGMETDLLTAKREYEIAREQHAGLVRKHEESQAASDMERRGQGESVELLEPPTLPSKSDNPPQWLRIVLFILGGFALGIFTCLIRVLRDPKIIHEGHLEKWAGLEILAVFPAAAVAPSRKIVTPRGGGTAQAWRRRATTTAVLGLSIIGVGCTDYFLNADTFWKRGQKAEKEGRRAAAQLFYRQAIRKDPRFAPAYRSAGLLALQQGELGPARDLLTRSVELDGKDPVIQTKLADVTYQIFGSDPGRPTTLLREVEAQAQKLQSNWPRLADGYRLQAQVLMERHLSEDAVKLLRAAASQVDNSETLDSQAAAALFRLGRVAEGESLLRALIERAPLYSAPYDLLYLHLMQRKDASGARSILDQKWNRTSEVDAALQLAAHDDAFGHRDGARQVLQMLEKDKAAGPLTLARMGDFWMHRSEYASARKVYENGRTRFPDNATDYISRIAEWHMAQGNREQAKKFVAAELASRPKDLILQTYASAIALTEVPAAERASERRKIESIMQQLPDSPFVRYHLGRAFLIEGRPNAAGEQFERCVLLDGNYAPGWVALAELEITRGNPSAAELRAEAVLRLDPNHVPANLVRAKAQVNRGKTADAEKSLERLLRWQPTNTDALYLMGSARLLRGKPDVALEMFEKGHALAPNETRWVLAKSEVLTLQGKAGDARANLESVAAGENAEESVLYMLASLQIQQKDSAAAVQTFQRIRRKDSAALGPRLGLAGALALSGDREKASALYAETEKLFPENVSVWLQHAALRSEMKDRQGALSKYEQALLRDKNNPLVLNNIAWMTLENGGSAEKALEYAQRARRVYGRSPEIDDTLASAYTRLAMFRNAAAIYEEMLAYLPPAARPRIQKLLESAKHNQAKKGAV